MDQDAQNVVNAANDTRVDAIKSLATAFVTLASRAKNARNHATLVSLTRNDRGYTDSRDLKSGNYNTTVLILTHTR